MTSPPTVACYSYLAATHTLNVEVYPRIDYGTEILSSEQFLAGDGPLVAAFLRAFGHPVVLGTNQVADDDAGHAILARLQDWEVPLAPNNSPVARTRTNVVVCDKAGHRTWYSDLEGVINELDGLHIPSLTACPILYLDAYEVLAEAPRNLLRATLTSGAYVFLNLGGSAAPDWLPAETNARRLAVLQTNAREDDPTDAEHLLNHLTELDVAEAVVVTAGRRGAVARTADGTRIAVPARPVTVRQVQGAGAAFSAALIYAHHHPDTPRPAGPLFHEHLRFACAAGSLWCSRTSNAQLPTPDEVRKLAKD